MVNVAILGFGTVGSGVADVLTRNSAVIDQRVDDLLRLKYILDVRDFPDSPYKDCFVKDFSVRLARPVTEITPAFLEALEQQPWKGNIRELRNVIERSLIVCESERLDVADLPLDIQNTHYEQSDETTPGSFELSAMERRHIARVLEYTKGNKTEAARLLKIGLTTLYRKIEEYGI